MRFYAICIFMLMSFVANAATCPNGYSELSVNENDKIVPMDEQCPDGTTEVYTVSDCSGANAGSVCAVCDGGALTSGGTCATLCSVGAKKINFGKNLSFDLLSDRTTKPSLNISMGRDKVCYVGLESGAGQGLNFKLPGNRVYHATNASSGGYRVCRAGHALSYVCNGNTVEKQILLDGGWYTLLSASACSAPEGKRFDGWYMDGEKQEPYKINVYNYNADKQMVARFFDAPDSYSINYYCSVEETSPVYSDVIEFDKRVAPQSLLCLTAKPYYTQIGWFTPFTSEEITHYQALCRAEGNTDCDIVIEDFLLVDSDLSLLFLVLMIVQGGQQNDSSSASDYLTKLMYEHVYISGDVAGEPIGKQVLDAGSDLNLYGVYARNGYQTIDDCGAIAMPYYYLFESNVGHYNEEFEVQGMCSFFYDWYINNQTDGGFGYAVGHVAEFVGWDIDGKIYAHGDKFVWDTQSDKNAIGIYDFNLHATFDCGADGVLASGGADVKYSGRGNGNDMIPLNINAVCAPNEGKRFVGWKLPYHDVTNPKGKDLYFEDVVFEVGDTLDWLDVIYAHDQTIITKEDGSRHQINKATDDFIAVYEDVE